MAVDLSSKISGPWSATNALFTGTYFQARNLLVVVDISLRGATTSYGTRGSGFAKMEKKGREHKNPLV